MFIDKEKIFSLIYEEVNKFLNEEKLPSSLTEVLPPYAAQAFNAAAGAVNQRKGRTSTVPRAIGRADLAGREWDSLKFDPDDVWNPLRTDDTKYQKSRQYGMSLPLHAAESFRYIGGGNWYLQDFSLPQGGPMTQHGSHQRGTDVDVSIPMVSGVEVESNPRWDGRRRFVGKRAANKGHAVYKTKKGTLGFFSPIAVEGGKTKSYIDPQRALDLIQHVLPVADKIFLDRAHIRAIRSYARTPIDKGGLGWDRQKTNNILKKVKHEDNHGHHFHIRFIDIDNPLSSKIKSGSKIIPKKWNPPSKGVSKSDKDLYYQDFKDSYKMHGEELFNMKNDFPAEFRVQFFRERVDDLKKAKYEMDKMYTPSAVGKTWADPEALDVGAGKFKTPDPPIKLDEPKKKTNFTPLDPKVDDDVNKFVKDLLKI